MKAVDNLFTFKFNCQDVSFFVEDGDFYFLAAHIATALCINEYTRVLRKHCPDARMSTFEKSLGLRVPRYKTISEREVYALINASKERHREQFRQRIRSEMVKVLLERVSFFTPDN